MERGGVRRDIQKAEIAKCVGPVRYFLARSYVQQIFCAIVNLGVGMGWGRDGMKESRSHHMMIFSQVLGI